MAARARLNASVQVTGGRHWITGAVVGSHLFPGAQELSPGKDDPAKLAHGVGITDGCIGWDDSVAVPEGSSATVKARHTGRQ